MKKIIGIIGFAFMVSSCAKPQSVSPYAARLEESNARLQALVAEQVNKQEALKQESKRRRDAEERERRERLPNIIKKLSDKGLTEGSVFWLKHPRGSIPALQKLVFIRVELPDKEPGWSDSDLRFFVKVQNELDTSFYEKGGALGTIDPTLWYYLEDPKSFTSKWPKQFLLAISEQKIMMGMTRDQAEAAWGVPYDINRSTGSWGTHEQWVYGKSRHSYLYFKNGRVSSWQN